MISGPRATKFTEGWGLRLFSWGKAHYFKREDDIGLCLSLCGREAALAGRLFEAGPWTRCKLCEKKVSKKKTAPTLVRGRRPSAKELGAP